MRPEGNPLDLNNLPDDHYYSRSDGIDNRSSPGRNKRVSGEDDGKEECGKVYECRFCSIKFCKSQALGGHMNRHRQEKETEKLNHARQLLFRNDHNLAAQAAPHLGCCLPIAPPGGYHPSGNMGDPAMPLRFPRFISAASSSTHIPPPPQPYLYASPSRPMSNFPSHFPQNDYHVGHVMSYGGGGDSSSYTCIGAPVMGQGLLRGMDGGKDGSLQNGLDGPSAINRFPDGF